MNPRQQALWERLQGFQVDHPNASLTFEKRLARENNWPQAFAQRAFEEYKKFLFLAMEAGHPVTPSDEVDQAWHLHMVYTRSYWHDLCGDLLGKPLHHGPTKGGRREGAKFEDWYARTLASYRTFFGEPPPDLWPAASERFERPIHFRRINIAENWIISKRAVRRTAVVGVSLIGGAAALAGCGAVIAKTTPNNSVAIGAFALLGTFSILAIIMGLRRSGSGTTCRRDRADGSGCSVGAWGTGHATDSSGTASSNHHGHSGGHHHGHSDGPADGHSGCHTDGGSGDGGSADGGSGCASSGCGGSGCGGGGGD